MTEGLLAICRVIKAHIVVEGFVDPSDVQPVLPHLRMHCRNDNEICELLGLTIEQLRWLESPQKAN